MAKLLRTSEPTEYRNARVASYNMRESNDCGVVAVTLATGASYETVHALLKKYGRKDRKGTHVSYIGKALNELGFTYRRWSPAEVVAMIHSYPGAHKGLSSITTHHPRRFPKAWANAPRNLMFYTSSYRHVLSVKDSEVQDWTVNKANRIEAIWEITKA